MPPAPESLVREPLVSPAGVADVDLEAFVRRHQTAVWRRLRALGCTAADADDLTQEAFLVAFDRGAPIDDRTARAFLHRTATNLWSNRRRTEARRSQGLVDAVDRLWADDCEPDDGDGWLADLAACVAGLPERSRRALELFYRDGCSRRDVGRALEIGEHGARTLLQRVRAALRECVERRRRR